MNRSVRARSIVIYLCLVVIVGLMITACPVMAEMTLFSRMPNRCQSSFSRTEAFSALSLSCPNRGERPSFSKKGFLRLTPRVTTFIQPLPRSTPGGGFFFPSEIVMFKTFPQL